MFSSDQLKDRIRKAAKDLGVNDVNRVRTIVTLERIVARLVTNRESWKIPMKKINGRTTFQCDSFIF